ncbi:MAG: TonB-dependent receptor [Gammaproteobacteria bacterium]|nr:TonB-dependent receptor [Gammaproteobacteria bacterium]
MTFSYPARSGLLPPLALGVFALAATPLHAQVLEEIIVTAQKREQSVQDVGISVTAYTGTQLHELGLTDTVDLTAMTPGLQYTVPNAEGSQINFFLRGVGLNEVADANENPVAVYNDEVYRAAMGGLHLQMFDMERAEVLRGPQGTLFGRNTSGGLIHFISNKPTDDFMAYVQGGAGSYGEWNTEAVINGRLLDTLAGRLSFAYDTNGGYVDNDFQGTDPVSGGDPDDFSESNALAGRVQLLWTPNEDFDALLKFHYSHNRGQVGAWQNQAATFPVVGGAPDFDNRVPLGPTEVNQFCPDGAGGFIPGPAPGTDCLGYLDTDGDPHEGSFDRDGDTAVTAAGIAGTLHWRLANGWEVTSITAFDHVDRTQEEDTDASPNSLIQVDFNAVPEQFTQELRLAGETDRLRWQGGFYYFNWDVEGDYHLRITADPFLNPDFLPPVFFFDVDYKQDTESWSVFGQAEYDLTDQFTLIGGIRYTEENKEMDYQMVDTTPFCLIFGVAGSCIGAFTDFGLTANFPSSIRPTRDHAILFNKDTVGDLAEHDKSNITGLIELDWKPTDDLLIYGKYSRGVKSAGFNSTFMDASFIFFSNTPETVPFDDETLTSYEGGFKATLFDGTTRLNASAFYYDYEDFQTFRFEFLSSVIFNTDAEIWGGEIELQTSPWEGWDFLLGASFLDAEAKAIPTTGTGALVDRTPVAAPDVTLNGMARYEWPMLGGNMAVVASFNYQDETYYDIQNYDIAKADDYIVGNVRLQWRSPDNAWELAAWVNNLADEEYLTYTFDFTGVAGFNQLHFGPPRWFGGSVRYTWQ